MANKKKDYKEEFKKLPPSNTFDYHQKKCFEINKYGIPYGCGAIAYNYYGEVKQCNWCGKKL